jgi:hypothetical protein
MKIPVAVALSLLLGCSSTKPQDPSAQRGYVDRKMLGDKWPLTVESGVLECSGGAVTFRSGGVVYAVNGLAMTWKRGIDIDPIWAAPEPQWTTFQGKKTNIAPAKKSIAPLIDAGRALCEQTSK